MSAFVACKPGCAGSKGHDVVVSKGDDLRTNRLPKPLLVYSLETLFGLFKDHACPSKASQKFDRRYKLW